MSVLRDVNSLPFPIAYSVLAMNGAKGGATKYGVLQFLNYARWTAQEHSVGFIPALKIMWHKNMFVGGEFKALGFFNMWRPSVTLLNESVHWGMKVPLSLGLYENLREPLGPHVGLVIGVAINTCAEVLFTGPTERLGVHMALSQVRGYSASHKTTRRWRTSTRLTLWNGGTGLWIRNFTWNLMFFEWKRAMHNALDRPGFAPCLLEPHFEWLRTQDPRNAANILTFEAACLATYLTFFNMAGDNVKTKMSAQPEKFQTVPFTVAYIYKHHGLLGFARGGLFKGAYLVAGATIAIGVQERLTSIMGKLLGDSGPSARW